MARHPLTFRRGGRPTSRSTDRCARGASGRAAVSAGRLGFAALLLATLGCATLVPTGHRDLDVERTLRSLSLEQRAAQLVFVRATGVPAHPEDPSRRELERLVGEVGVGGVVLFDSDLDTARQRIGRLRQLAPIPLLVASDLETGAAYRVRRGAVRLPSAMALGATDSAAFAREAGEITGREARALGIDWVLAPVVDVNSNPDNPVIGIRSFGEDPRRVAALARAFVEGVQSAGILATAKHFPGHGDTAVDSHDALPVLGVDRDRLERIELLPFRALIEADVASVMTGHLAVPALDPSGAPASLSSRITSELLRDELGFDGLIVTDALEMEGAAWGWPGGDAVRALKAGADVLLLPGDPIVAIDAIVRAVESGELDREALDRSVRRVLRAKRDLAARSTPGATSGGGEAEVGAPADLERSRAIAEAGVTAVRDEAGLLPLRAERISRLVHLVLQDRPARSSAARFAAESIALRVPDAVTLDVPTELSAERFEEILSVAAGADALVLSTAARGPELAPAQRSLIERLTERGAPPILLGLSSPYVLREAPSIPTFLASYGASDASQEATVAALFGEIPLRGRLPVSLGREHPVGSGLQIDARAMVLGPSDRRLDEVDRVAEAFVEAGAFPGAVVFAARQGEVVHHAGYGRQTFEPESAPVTAETIYDLASLTKVVATTTMAMILVDEGRLTLETRVADVLPSFRGPGKGEITVRHLLTHSSGIDWWAPLYEELSGWDAYVERIAAMELAYPPDSRSVYSDLGIILLGEILERAAGVPFERFVRERIFEPLGMVDTGFRPNSALLHRIAPTELDEAWRRRLLHGEVHDENAQALGGVAPHAGLFSTARDLGHFAQMILQGGVYRHRRIVSREVVEQFTQPAGVVPDSTRALGWDTKSPKGSSAGSFFSPSSFGHTGFTGTSIWIDPERELSLVILTNRVHPTRENRQIRKARPAIADALVRALEPETGTATREPVLVGLDRIARGTAPPLPGRRLGLVAHRASVTLEGEHAIDVLTDAGYEVARIFAPEHGLRGEVGAGVAIASDRDAATGLPIVSLYGARRAPAVHELADLDALVFDLQGAGVRFYTYVSTMILALEAAAEAGVPFVIFDRPNPLGGKLVAGPVAASRDLVPASFLNLAPGPLVHGLTLGEMARYVHDARGLSSELVVLPMLGWEREMTWAETERPWIPPSPNLRSPEAALAYPGVALLEATNLSEGRGTDAPFLRFGAPWLRASIPRSARGFALEPIEFTPSSSPAALHPKHEGALCRGFRISIAESEKIEPYAFGVELLARLLRDPGFQWLDGGRALTRLVGHPRVHAALVSGADLETLFALDRREHATWLEERAPALLY